MKRTAAASRAPGAKFGGFGAPGGTGALSYLTEPPSFSAVSDPNVVVSLKNLLKKDSTTKTKALEDLVAYVRAQPFEKNGGVEDAILDVWTDIYPRTAIDNARRVRELAHNLQFEAIKSARRRAERHIPKIVGAWLAGLYDRDRGVARAASDGLSSFINTPEKVAAFWRKCQTQILDYAIDAIRETQDTLSDERSTTKDDAEAKYLRVIGSSLSLVLSLLQRLNDEEISKQSHKLDEFFDEETVWRAITFNDSSVRKSVCHLVITCLSRKLPYAESTQAKQAIVTGGFKTSQTGSALDYVRALTRLSQVAPDIWTPSPKEKKPALLRLRQFIEKGSQGCPAKFWEHLDELISVLPEDQMKKLETASEFLDAVKAGVTNREEPRTNTSMAWKCFIDTLKRLNKNLSEDEEKLEFARRQICPLFENSLLTISDRPVAIPLGPNAMTILVEAHLTILRGSSNVVSVSAEEWQRLADMLCNKISNSLPEVSREYQASQEKIFEEGRRWFSLVGEIHRKLVSLGESLPDQTAAPSKKVISHCIDILQNRNMKPFGAAGVLEYALSTSQHLFDGETGDKTAEFLSAAAGDSIEKVIQSASSRPLLSCLNLLGAIPSREPTYRKIWGAWVEAVSEVSDRTVRNSALASLISEEKASELTQSNAKLQTYIVTEAIEAVKGEASGWSLLEAGMSGQGLSDESCKQLSEKVLEILDKEPEFVEPALRALEVLAKGKPKLFTENSSLHTALVAQLLSLTEISNSVVSSKAIAIRAILQGDGAGNQPVVQIIHDNLEQAGPQSLDIETLSKQAQQAHAAGIAVEEIFPSTNIWMQKLAPFLDQPINPSLSITNSLGGAVTLTNSAVRPTEIRVHRDKKGRSVPLRMSLYSAHLLEEGIDIATLPREFQIELLFIQSLTIQLATDQIDSMDDKSLWLGLESDESVSEAESLVTTLKNFINKKSLVSKWWDNSVDSEQAHVFRGLVDLLKEESKELTPRGVYSARAISEIVQVFSEAHSLSSDLEETLLKPVLTKAAPETALLAAAMLSGLGETLETSKIASTFLNRLVSDIAGASASGDKTMITLVLLNLSAQVYESGELPVANNRIVFAVKQITSWLENEEPLSAPLSAEICRVLNQLLPCMSDVFGSYWEKAIDFSLDLWDRAVEHPLPDALPFIHSSLKLIKTLKSLEDPNDDLQDALRESASKRSKSLVGLLKLPRGASSQPLEIVDAMLCREVEKVSIKSIKDVSDIYELVASESQDIQTAAFDILHRAIPAIQEQRSIDTVLDKTGEIFVSAYHC